MKYKKADYRQIIAMGGGGFSMEPGNPLLDDYVLSQSPVENPRICLIPTASNDAMEYIELFYDYCMTRNCTPSHLSLFNPATRDFESFLLENDIIYVTGGHTGHMLRRWNAFGVDAILKKALELGIILAGVSAGASCWFEWGFTDSNPERLSGEPCLGFLRGSHCAHFENEGRREEFHQAMLSNEIPSGIGTENCAALHFVDERLLRVVSSRPGVSAYMTTRQAGQIEEKTLEGKYLGTELPPAAIQ